MLTTTSYYDIHKKLVSVKKDFFTIVNEYNYIYDKKGNWIEKTINRKDKAPKKITRKIKYS